MATTSSYMTSAKACFDVSMWVFAIFVLCFHTYNHKQFINSPFRFSTFTVKPYTDYDSIEKFFTASVIGKDFCTNATICQTSSALLLAAQTAFNCTDATSVAGTKPGMCSKCVDIYTPRIYTYGNALAGNGPVVETNADWIALREQFESCLFRQSTWSFMDYYHDTNVLLHFFWWCGVVASFTIMTCVDYVSTDKKSTRYMLYAFSCLILFITWVMFLVIALAPSLDVDSPQNARRYSSTYRVDLIIWGFQTFVLLVAAFAYFPVNNYMRDILKLDFNKEVPALYKFSNRTIIFDICLLATLPSIIMLVCAYRGWMDMSIFGSFLSIFIVVFAVSLADDLLNVFWSATPVSATMHGMLAMHAQIHMGIVILVLFTIVSVFSASLPAPATGDIFFGAMHSVLFLVFVLSMTVAPSMFHEFSTKDAVDILALKEGGEVVYRLIVLVVILCVMFKPDTGTIVV